jgi:hypothetical protein
MKKTYLHIVVIVCFIISAGLTLGYFWGHKLWPVNSQGTEATPRLSATPMPTSGYFTAGATLQWKQITASNSGTVPHDLLAFTVTTGQAVAEFQAGASYFIADKDAYQNFIPKTVDQAARLQLPSTGLTKLGPNSAFVVPIAPWLVPEDIPEVLRYGVNFKDDYYDTHPAPAGTLITTPFTLWINKW